MKNKFSFFLLGIALLAIQACELKTENFDVLPIVTIPVIAVAYTADERSARIETTRKEFAEQRRIDLWNNQLKRSTSGL